MKKIFTLFMATMVAVSMMALPQNVKLAGKTAKPASQEQFVAKTPAQAKALEMAKDAKVLRSFERVEAPAKKVAAKSPLKVAAAVQADTIELNFDGFSVVPEYYEESGDWYMAMSQDYWIVKFDILAESYLGTFTEADLDLYYSYILTEYDEYVDFNKVVLTISETVKSQYCTVLNLHAVIDGSDGNVYVVTCQHQFLSPKSEVEHVLTGATLTYDAWESIVTIAGENDELNVNLTYWATWPTGRYTHGDLDLEATQITHNGVEQTLMNTELLVGADMVDGTLAYVAAVDYYNQDTILNHLAITAPVAPATDTVNIEILNLQVDDSWAMYFGWVYLTGESSEWSIYGGVAGYEATEGEWAGEEEVMLYVTDLAAGEETEAIYATASMVEDDEKGWLVVLEGHCTDGKYYVVNMKFEVPEPTSTVELSFDNSAKAAFYPDLGNDLYLANENDEYFVALDIYGVPMGGEFTYDNMDTYYTQLVKWGESEYDYTEIQIAAVEGKVYQTGDTTWMVAEIIGFDAVLYKVELWYAVPTPTEVVELTVEATFENHLESDGYYTLFGTPENSDLLIAMSPITEEVAGTFENDGLFAGFGAEGGKYDFYAEYTYVAKPLGEDEWGDPQYDVYSVEKGTMEVTLDEENNIVAKVSVICSNAVQYNITMTSKYDKPHLQYDAEVPVEKIYTSEDVVAAEYDPEYSVVYWEASAADGSDLCAVYFFVEEPDAETVVPVGTYTIDGTMDYGTVMASTGYDPYYGVSPSVYATVDVETGYLNVPLWFMVGGTVEVTKSETGALKIEVNALNSYDQTIHIVYEGAGTGLEDLNVQTQGVRKQIVDGQLVIVRDGKAYNAVGTQVK